MADYKDREHFIPLRKSELIELLCAEGSMGEPDRERFRQFCKLVGAVVLFEVNQHLEVLKTAYAPFDPDSDTVSLIPLSAEERQHRLNELFRDFAWTMERANFKHLSREDLEPGLDRSSEWGIHMDVDFSVFERMALFARGDTLQTRDRYRLRNFYRKEEAQVPIYQRLVLILKLRPHPRLEREINTDRVYLKIFKDIPKLDVKMLLPTARVHFSLMDRSKVSLPLLSGVGLALWNVITAGINILTRLLDELLSLIVSGANPSLALWGLVSGAFGYGYRSYYGYQQTKQRYHFNLTQSLYYQNLDSNSGVLFRLLDEAEEQECREVLLGYFCLWRFAPEAGWTGKELDDFIETYLERNTGIRVDFEVEEALPKLERLHLVEKHDNRYRACPIAQAMETLDATWDNYFQYKKPVEVQAPRKGASGH